MQCNAVEVVADRVCRQLGASEIIVLAAPDYNHAPRNAAESEQSGLDLRELNPVPAELDLPVASTEELECSVLAPAPEVAASVEALPLAENGARDEPGRRQLVTVDVSKSDAVPRDPQFASRADRSEQTRPCRRHKPPSPEADARSNCRRARHRCVRCNAP